MTIKVAVVQKPPVLLDLEATLARALESLDEAAAAGSRLVVFPEAYLPGYPTWIWRVRPGGDMALSGDIHARLHKNAVDIAAGGLDPLRDGEGGETGDGTVTVEAEGLESRVTPFPVPASTKPQP